MPARDPAESRLEAEARYHRERLALYRARVFSAKPTSPNRLRELERTSRAADARLRAARGPQSIAEQVRETIARNDAARTRRLHAVHPERLPPGGE
jgi:hypothetical protein